MKRFLFLLALLPCLAGAQSLALFPSPQHRVAAAGGATALISENFEGTGTPSGWTDRSPVNYDFPTTGLSLQGSQCFKAGADGGTTTASFAAQSECWLYAQVRITNHAADTFAIRLQDSGGATVACMQWVYDSPDIRPKATSDAAHLSSELPSALSVDTTYFLKLHYKKGTGADAIADIEFSTDGTFSGSGTKFISITTGAATTDATKVFLYENDPVLWGMHVDRLSVWSTDQGNFPASP